VERLVARRRRELRDGAYGGMVIGLARGHQSEHRSSSPREACYATSVHSAASRITKDVDVLPLTGGHSAEKRTEAAGGLLSRAVSTARSKFFDSATASASEIPCGGASSLKKRRAHDVVLRYSAEGTAATIVPSGLTMKSLPRQLARALQKQAKKTANERKSRIRVRA
jgi:hypothetical protein